jgi:small subunit ribosomal protein S24e
MDFEFIKEEENKLLNRTELDFVLTYDGATPSRKEILGKLCALRNVKPELCVLSSLKTEFGKQEIAAQARIYEDAEVLKSTELNHIVENSTFAPDVPETEEGAGEEVTEE